MVKEIFTRRNIVSPELVFGDMTRAIIIKRKDFMCPVRKCMCVRFALKPTKMLAQMHNISDDSLKNGFIIKVYEKHLVIDNASQDPSTMNATIVLCDWNEGTTKLTEMHKTLLKKIDVITGENYYLNGEVFSLQEQMEEMKSRPQSGWENSLRQLSMAKKVVGNNEIFVNKKNSSVQVEDL